MNSKMKIIIMIVLTMLITTHSQANLSKDIECSAAYSGIAVGLNKQGKYELSEKFQSAAKIRTQRIILQIGREQGRNKVIHSMKTIRQKYSDYEFQSIVGECIKDDGIKKP